MAKVANKDKAFANPVSFRIKSKLTGATGIATVRWSDGSFAVKMDDGHWEEMAEWEFDRIAA